MAALLALAVGAVLALLLAGRPAVSQTTVQAPAVEIVEEDGGTFAMLTGYILDFQRRANAEIATHMTAIERGDDLGAFFLGLAIAFACGVIHAFGPGHGKFVIVSYFLGREVRVARGVVMAAQVAIVHVIAAVIIVWLADAVLRAGFGIGLAEVPGVRAASFLIIVGIGVYMLYQAVKTSTSPSSGSWAAHGHSHGHGHGHGHSHHHGHSHSLEGGMLALAAGMIPCPGAVLIMLYAVANDMIYPDGKERMWISSSSNCLMKKCVTRLRGLISWPGLEATEHFRKGKTYREQDVGELHLLRLLVERAGLIRSAGLWFELTPLGRALLEPGRRGTLQALLFRHAFWDTDLSRFVRVHPRGLPRWWPQGEIGVILWALSAVAEDWQNAGALTALCTIPDDELPETRRGAASTMFVWRILWPVRWFGLLEYRGPEETRDVAWRKSVLFDRFLSFDVGLSDNRGSSH